MLTPTINALFDEIKARHGLKSDAALARHLAAQAGEPVSEMAIVRWRRGEYPKALDVLGAQLVAYAEAIRPNQPAA